jgi:NitT/TauT family transport system substrate-binding protein
MLRRTLATVGLVMAAVAVLLSGGPSFAQEKTPLEKITFATDWKAQAEHGGFYQALATGLYRKHGLDVTIRMGGPGSDTQQLLAAGAVDMALGSNSFYPMNLVQAGAPVRAVMASFQKDPQILMTHPRDDIKSIADMKGKPILISTTARSTFWVWLKGKYGFTDDQIRSYTFNMAPWLLDRTAIQQGYLSSEPYQVKMEGGVEPQVYLLADAGYPSYSTLVLASQKLIDQKPDVVQAFVDATIEGWYSYLHGDPTPGNALIRKDNPEMTNGTIAYGIARMKEYGIADSGDAVKLGIGAMTAERWKTFFDTMVAEGVYPADLDQTKAYTLAFVNKAHAIGMRK